LFLRKMSYHLRMDDGDFMRENINSFNTMVSQLFYVVIKIEEEDKCITLLSSLLYIIFCCKDI